MYLYINVDSPNLGFPYFNFFWGVPVKKNTLYVQNNPVSLHVLKHVKPFSRLPGGSLIVYLIHNSTGVLTVLAKVTVL